MQKGRQKEGMECLRNRKKEWEQEGGRHHSLIFCYVKYLQTSCKQRYIWKHLVRIASAEHSTWGWKPPAFSWALLQKLRLPVSCITFSELCQASSNVCYALGRDCVNSKVVTFPLKIASLHLFCYSLCFSHLLPPTPTVSTPQQFLLLICQETSFQQNNAKFGLK